MDKAGTYTVDCPITNEDILEKASDILLERINHSDVITNPQDTRTFLKFKISAREHEVFVVLFLDNRHRLIAYKELFRGTVDGASVYPREVVKEALTYNAAALIVAHNHPSGNAEPSKADERITSRLKQALGLVDIRILDHLIIGCDEIVSLAERGVL
ncbi:MAG: DNA repair protein RadC [Gammaproteobacteria bacterium]|nr:DNA repair protein RadC [Gammaproteobacteria bacterium]